MHTGEIHTTKTPYHVAIATVQSAHLSETREYEEETRQTHAHENPYF